jgi:hypothetical protein
MKTILWPVTSKMKYKLPIVVFIVLAISVAVFVYLNISYEYPVAKVCKEIRVFNLQHRHFPTIDEFNSLNMPEPKLFSVLKYRTTNDDFLFYFCPTRLGPCEVCTAKEGPYVDEI